MEPPGTKLLVPPQLYGTNYKINRAWDHLNELKDLVNRFQTGYRYTVVRERDTQRGLNVYIMDCTETPNPVFLPMIGIVVAEIAHQLRSTLDHIVCGLVRSKGGEVTDRNGFPIFKVPNPGRFEPVVAGLDTAEKQAIMGLQPYKRTPQAVQDDPLFILHEIDRVDKHSAIAVSAGVSEIDFHAMPGPGVRWQFDAKLNNGLGRMTYTWPISNDPEFNFEPDFPIYVAFDITGNIAPGMSVTKVMLDAHNTVVEEIWPELVRFFPGYSG